MRISICIFIISILPCSCGLLPESGCARNTNPWQPLYRVMFWNVENLFDIYNDSLINDDEFTPYGIRAWNYTKYKQKINNIYKVFLAAGNPDPPDIIALSEVENHRVLYDLTVTSPFGKFGYKIIHKDSEDRRGIDVAVIYNPRKIRLLQKEFFRPVFRVSAELTTRDIVFLKAEVNEKDTVYFFFCHWPSKYGGAGLTDPLRQDVASCLRSLIDSVRQENNNALIIAGGDFNDPPSSESVRNVLDTHCYSKNDTIYHDRLYNLSCYARPGTHKHQGIWETIDQFIVSGNLVKPSGNEKIVRTEFEIFAPGFLLETDEKFSGTKPFRTWEGMRYKGGFSDHLPVILNVY
jgi:hypothetical protein